MRNELSACKQLIKKQELQIEILKTELLKISQMQIGIRGSGVLLSKLLSKISSLFECSISCQPMRNPVILKSGNTIDEEVFNRLRVDPFDKSKL
jgi:hypothetical protein